MNFDEAVDYSKEYLGERKDILERDSAIDFWATAVAANMTTTPPLTPVVERAEHLFEFVGKLKDHWANEARKRIVLALIDEGVPLPVSMRDWHRQEMLRANAVRKPKRESWKGKHFAICFCVKHLVDNGVGLSRNQTTEASSAFDAVAEAMRSLGLAPNSASGIKDIWYETTKS